MSGKVKTSSMRRTPENKQRRIRKQLALCENALMVLEERIEVDDGEASEHLTSKRRRLEAHISSLQRWLTFWRSGGKPRSQR